MTSVNGITKIKEFILLLMIKIDDIFGFTALIPPIA